MHFSKSLSPILYAILLIGILSIFTFVTDPMQKAWALSITTVANGATAEGIARTNDKVFVASVGGDTISVYNANTRALITTISSITNPQYGFVSGGRVYFLEQLGGNVYEIDATNNVLLRTIASGCNAQAAFAVAGKLFCVTTGNLVKTVTLTTGVVVTSASTNSGGAACNIIAGLAYDNANDRMFYTCTTSARLAVAEGFTASAVPDFATSFTGPNGVAFDATNNKVYVCGTQNPRIYNYTAGAGFTLWQTFTGDGTNCTRYAILDTGNRFINSDTVTDIVYVYDPATGTQIVNFGSGSNINSAHFFSYSSTILYMTTGTANNWLEIDLSGVALGSGGGTLSAICRIDTNFDGTVDIVYNDIGGPDGVPPNGVPDGICDAGSLPLGGQPVNQTSCNIGFALGLIADSNGDGLPDNCNPAVNGLGYLLVIVLLAIMIGLFALAHAKTGLEVPDWLFMVGTFGVIGAAMAFGWIDSTLFVIGVVIVAGMAATKFVSRLSLGGFR